MDTAEIYQELKMSYHDLVSYLLQKYGGAMCDYFITPECRTKNKKVTRSGEGLYCHHMDEDKVPLLSEERIARSAPFEYQKKDRLVYCNALEHLILHIKIAILFQKGHPELNIGLIFHNGIPYICNEINDMYIYDGTNVAWRKRSYEEIKENYEDYILLLRVILAYEKPASYIFAGLKMEHTVEQTAKWLSEGFRKASGREFFEKIYNDIMQYNQMEKVEDCVRMLNAN